ncbi:hypothetical protein [Candidatus Uabimicrobium sp. HlEnr_7]|uniref:hypothetical protein n=1 Tax=Candidatus Uabimicrobium helgolandensis TaxID=3095367 RepID=UPI00355741C1
MDEIVILESKSLRTKLCTDKNINLLDHAGQLATVGNSNLATIKQVAHFYGIPIETIKTIVHRHRDELTEDGYKVFSSKDFQKFQDESFEISNRGIALFPRKAILRVGMLLRDSIVAKLVRSYLLNVEEHLSYSPATQNILQHMVAQLNQHAEQLIKNAGQLSYQAGELKEHAQQMRSQSHMIKVIVDEIYTNRDFTKKVDADLQATKSRIKSLEQQYQNYSTDKYVTAEQINVLKAKVKKKGNPISVWAKLKSHFGVARYSFLPQRKFRDVIAWLENYESK